MIPLGVFHWNGDPEIFRIGSFALRWYSLMWLSGFLIALQMMRGFFRREGRSVDKLDDLLLVVLAGGLIGARLGHVFFYHSDYYLSHWSEILMFWKGGLASHGGMVGILIATWLWTRRHSEFGHLWLLDRIAVPTALGGALIRVGNLFNSEILGRETTVPWAIVFERVDDVPRHPVMLYEASAYLLTFVTLVAVYRRTTPGPRTGHLLGLFLVMVFSARFLLEPFKLRQAEFAQDWALSVGQLLSVPAVIAGLILLVRAARSSSADDS